MSAEPLSGTPPKARATPATMARRRAVLLELVGAEHPATVRSIFYRCLSVPETAELWPAGKSGDATYDAVQIALLAMRREGLVPPGWIVDLGRSIRRPGVWSSLSAALAVQRRAYRRNPWQDQPELVLVALEKDALVATVESVTDRYAVPVLSSRGFSSESFTHDIAEMVTEQADDRPVHLLQLGDHDPSGVVAWSAVSRRVAELAPDTDLHVERVAVTAEQVDRLGLITRTTKPAHDARGRLVNAHALAAEWQAVDQGYSVETEALPPTELRRLLAEAITGRIDQAAWAETIREQARELAAS